jgi:hypothetical protein
MDHVHHARQSMLSQIMVVTESQSRAPALSFSSFALFTTNVSRCASAAMNVVFPLRSPFAQMTPERMRPEADGWTRSENERQHHGCVVIHPGAFAHMRWEQGNRGVLCLTNGTSTLMPFLLDTFLSHVASRQAEITGLSVARKLIKKERT